MTKSITSLFTPQPKSLITVLASFSVMAILSGPVAQAQLPHHLKQIRAANNPKLDSLAKAASEIFERNRAEAVKKAIENNWPLEFPAHGDKPAQVLYQLDALGIPEYASVDNLGPALTIAVAPVWPSGNTGYNLSGKGLLAGEWDGGSALATHVEFGGRVVNRESVGADGHATHVAGTIAGRGLNAEAKGMAYEANLGVYSFSNAIGKFAGEANRGALAGNNSWGVQRGFRSTGTGWDFAGPASPVNQPDPGFGYYSSSARDWDQQAFNMPYMLLCKSAGNQRGDGPRAGQSYTAGGQTFTQGAVGSATYRPLNGPYDCLANFANSKNILVVAAVNENRAGYTTPSRVVMSSFGSWGPTDDGRIKPDISSVGVNVFSTYTPNSNSYASLSGTSMSTPTMTGACVLLQEQYSNTHKGRLMRAETLKGLIIHTADEAGAAEGPDYAFGWGLANIKRAADVIYRDSVQHLIKELVYTGTAITIPVSVGQPGPLRATISWHDLPGSVDGSMPLNNRTPKLVTDLDLRIRRLSDGQEFLPYVLDPANPAAAATRGDNIVDNVEQVFLANATPGAYEIIIRHKGNLQRPQNTFGLIVSGNTGPKPDFQCHPLLTYSASVGTLTDGSGTASYQANADCQWQLDMQDTTTAIRLSLRNLDLSAGDTLYIFQGTATNRTLLGKYSGSTIPAALVAIKGMAYIRFTSGTTGGGAGFTLDWTMLTLPTVTVASSNTTVCSGSSVTFTASTLSAADTVGVTWSWNIPGAIPPNPTGINPVVTLPNPGTYLATVTFTNAIGTGTSTSTVPVRAVNGTVFNTGYYEERFDNIITWPVNPVDTNGNWRREATSAVNSNWTRTTLAAVSQPASLFAANNTVPAGTVRNLISPVLNLAGLVQGARLQFKIASAPRATGNSDELRLFYSTNCGANWTAMAYTRSGTTSPSIYTVTGNRTFPFIPDSTEWRTETVSIPNAALLAQRVMFRWQYTNVASLGIYLDDVMVGTLVSNPRQIEQVQHLVTVFPNPAEEVMPTIRLDTDPSLPVQLSFNDMLGRVVHYHLPANADRRTISLQEVTNSALPAGVYNLVVQQGNQRQTVKVVIR